MLLRYSKFLPGCKILALPIVTVYYLLNSLQDWLCPNLWTCNVGFKRGNGMLNSKEVVVDLGVQHHAEGVSSGKLPWTRPELSVAGIENVTLLVGSLSCDGPNSGLVNLEALGLSVCL